MLIGEVVKRTGLSRDTIRFYEKKGLIDKGKKENQFNNYKEYSEETVKRLHSIKRIKSFGFTLNEVAEMLDLIERNVASCDNIGEKMQEKIRLLDDKIKELEEIKSLMKNGIDSCESYCSPDEAEENCRMIVSDEFVKG